MKKCLSYVFIIFHKKKNCEKTFIKFFHTMKLIISIFFDVLDFFKEKNFLPDFVALKFLMGSQM